MTSDPEEIPDSSFPGETEPKPPSAEDRAGAVYSSGPLSPRVWGPWATVGWTLLCLGVLVIAQIAVFIIFVVVRVAQAPAAKPDNFDTLGAELASNGNLLATATLVSTLAVIGLVALLIRIRRYPIREYLALSLPGARAIFFSVAGLAAVLAASDLTSYSLGRPIVPEVMVEVYRKAWLPFLLLAMVILAPLGEETLFRGFLYKGIESSRAGPVTAIVVSAILFSVVHVQYDWYGILTVAAMGLYLGFARYRYASLPLTMLLHAISNAVATAEVFVQLHWTPR